MKKIILLLSCNALTILLLLLMGCFPDKKEKALLEFYLSQPRNSQIIGKYQFIDEDRSKEAWLFHEEGELRISIDTIMVEPLTYWYSTNDSIFTFRLGDQDNQMREMPYKYNLNNTLDTLTIDYKVKDGMRQARLRRL